MSMDQTTLAAQVREKTGKGVAHRLRAQKLIPAVVYGPHSEAPLNIAVDPKALREAIRTPHKMNTILTLKLDQGGERMALLKDFQQDPVSRAVLHADFYEVKMGETVIVPVPLVLEGRAEGVAAGGILTQLRREVDIVCTPDAIPERLVHDVTALKAGAALHVADLSVPEGVKIRFLTNYTVATISVPEEEVASPAAAEAAAPKGKK
jgi:large subunit ribosomal protein L25